MQNISTRLVWGGLFILLGMLFLAETLFDAEVVGSVVRWWPTLIILLGIWIGFRQRAAIVLGALIVFLGAVLLAGSLDIVQFNLWNLWPLILVAIGISILFRPGASGDASQVEELSEVTVFGGTKRVVDSKGFKHGTVTSVFSGTEIDFRNTTFADNAVVEVVAVLGAIEMRMPDDVTVVNEALAVLGSVEDHRSGSKDSKTKVVIKGVAVLGGVEIH